jgi:hypothetical protein
VLLPELPLDEPVAPPSAPLPPEGDAGVLSGGMAEPLIEPDCAPVASAPSPDAAKVVTDAADNKPARIREVTLMFIMVRLPE